MFTSNFLNSPSQLTAAINAGEAVQAGDLIAVGADGNGYWINDPTLAVGPLWRPFSQAATANMVPIGANTVVAASADGPSGGYFPLAAISAKLANGNIVVVWSNTGSPYNVFFAIYTAVGILVVSPTVVGAGLNIGGTLVSVAALTGGGFAIASQTSSGYVAVNSYNAAGVLQGSAATTDTPTSSVAVVGLANGSFAVNYITTGSVCRSAVYSSTCAVVAAAFNVITGGPSTSQSAVAIAALTGGGFVILAATVAGSSSNPVAYVVYSNTGSVVTAQTTFTNSYSGQYPSAVALTGGGFALAVNETGSSSVGMKVGAYSATGVLQGSVVSLDTTANLGGMPMAASATSGGFYVMWNSAAVPSVAKFTSGGVQVGSTLALSAGAGGGGTSFPWALAPSPDDGALAILSNGSNAIAVVVSPTVTQTYPYSSIAIPNSVFNFGAYVAAAGGNAVSQYFSLVTLYNNGVVMNAYAYQVQQAQFQGVATAATAKGSSIPIQITGAVPTRLYFSQPYQWDKVKLIGNSAIILNLLFTPRNIN